MSYGTNMIVPTQDVVYVNLHGHTFMFSKLNHFGNIFRKVLIYMMKNNLSSISDVINHRDSYNCAVPHKK